MSRQGCHVEGCGSFANGFSNGELVAEGMGEHLGGDLLNKWKDDAENTIQRDCLVIVEATEQFRNTLGEVVEEVASGGCRSRSIHENVGFASTRS